MLGCLRSTLNILDAAVALDRESLPSDTSLVQRGERKSVREQKDWEEKCAFAKLFDNLLL
jgi:hypothetical protein